MPEPKRENPLEQRAPRGPRFERAARPERTEIAPPSIVVDPESGVAREFEEAERYAPGADPRTIGMATQPEEALLRETVGARAPRILAAIIAFTLIAAVALGVGWQLGYGSAEKEAHEKILRAQIEESERNKPKVPAPPQALEAGAVEAIERALKAEAAGDLASAEAALAEAERLSPTTPGILLRRAKLAVRNGNFLEAEKFLAEAAQRNERRAEARNLRALLAATQQQWPMAEAMFREAIDADPFDGRTYYAWGETMRKQGKLVQAVEALAAAQRRDFDRADRDLYRLKLELAQVELDPKGAIATEILADAKKSFASPVKLAAAAAALLLAGDTKAGVALLDRIRPQAPAWLWREMRGDTLFRRLAGDPDVLAALSAETR